MLDPKGLEAAARAIRSGIWETEPNPTTERYCADLRQQAKDQAEAAIRAYLEATGETPPPGWPDPLESPQAEAIRNGKLDDTEIRNLFDTMERELRLHRERAGEAKLVAVKALEWIAEGDASFAAKSLAGSYVIGKDEKGGKGWQWGFVGDARDWAISEFFDTSDEAKAAAQADYERRILSCLSHPAQGWREMDSAPGDEETPVLLWIGGQRAVGLTWRRKDGTVIGKAAMFGNTHADLWMPLPTAPAGGSDE